MIADDSRTAAGAERMIVTCPNCGADLVVDPLRLGPAGRRVRCGSCRHVWHAMPPEPLPMPPPDEVPSPDTAPIAGGEPIMRATMDAPPAVPAGDRPTPDAPSAPPREKDKKRSRVPVRRVRSARTSVAGWPLLAASVVALLALSGLALHLRVSIVALLPATARLYAAVGYPVNVRGIDIVGVRSRIVQEDGQPLLVIEGELVNRERVAVPVPRLRFAVMGEGNAEIHTWTAAADVTRLDPGGRTVFRRELASPPEGAQRLAVRFLSARDLAATQP